MRNEARGRRSFLLGCGVVVALTALPAAADQTDELARLREEAAQLRQRLDGLDARIRALEHQDADSVPRQEAGGLDAARGKAAPATPIPPIVSLKRNWAEVEPGTPEDRVQALLGKPEKTLLIDGTRVWYYVYPGIGRGSVFFNANGRVSSAQSPSLGW